MSIRSSASLATADLRRRLVALLGGKCLDCGYPRGLQFDLKISDGGHHHRFSWPKRIRFYFRQFQLGNVELRCAACHQEKTARLSGPAPAGRF
jgi:hypothetical protein